MHYLSSQLFLVVGVPGSRAVVEYFPAVVEYAGQIPRVAYQQQKRGKSCIALLQHKRAWQLKPNNTTTAKYTHITTLYLTSLWRRSVAAGCAIADLLPGIIYLHNLYISNKDATGIHRSIS